MRAVLTERVQALLHAEPGRSTFRCPECGSFFDTPRIDPGTGNAARKCMSCEKWYPVAVRRWEGSD
jgi:uncharacterized paraquat-inducible protein A